MLTFAEFVLKFWFADEGQLELLSLTGTERYRVDTEEAIEAEMAFFNAKEYESKSTGILRRISCPRLIS